MTGHWFRCYDELVDDPKVQMLSDRNFRALVNIWCLASRNDGALPPIDQVAFSLRMKAKQLSEIFGQLTAADLLEDEEGVVRPHNWAGRQFKSDVTDPTAADRNRRYRERNADRNGKRNGDRNASRIGDGPQITDTDTEAEKNNPEGEKTFPSVAPSQASGAAVLELVAEDEQPDIPAILDRRPYPEAFEALWDEYRPIANANATKADAHRAWAKLSAADKAACFEGLALYASWLREETRNRAQSKRSPVEVKHLATFINKRGWEPFLEQEARRAAG